MTAPRPRPHDPGVIARLILALTALVIAAPSAAQTGWWRGAGFEIDRDDTSCTLHRPFLPTDRTRVTLRGELGGARILTLSSRQWRFKEGQTYRLRLMPTQPNSQIGWVEGPGTGFRTPDKWSGVRMTLAPANLTASPFVDRETQFFDITARPRRIGVIPTLMGIQSSPFNRCISELAGRERGSGLPADSPPTPRGRIATWMTFDDYPAAAIRAQQQGTVTMRLTISARGRVTGCQILRSSGSYVLDEASCGLFRRRGRYFAARDANGDATESSYEQGLEWTLPPEWFQ